MKRNMQKVRVIFLSIVLFLLPLSGCGGKELSLENREEAVGNASERDELPEKEELTGELVYWSNWNETETQGMVLSEAIREFEQIHPGVSIKVVWNGRENRKLLLPALESGQQLDFFEQTADLVMDSLGDYLLDLSPYYEKTYPGTDGKKYEDCIMPAPLELIKSKKEGGIYAVPYQPNMWCVFYNKEHFRTAGITQLPGTWDEFLAVCETLKNAGYIPMTSDDAYLGQLPALHLERLKGEEYMDGCVKGNDPSRWEDPAIVRAFRDYKELIDKEYLSPYVLTNKYPAGQQELAVGEVSMYVNGSWLPNEVMTTAGQDFEWGAFPYPVLDAAVSDQTHVQYNCQALGINKNTKYPEAAFAFAVFITTGKWDQELSEKTVGIPMSIGAEWPVQLMDVKPIFDNAKVRISSGFGLLNNGEKNPVIVETFVNVLNGSFTPVEAVEKLK